MSEAKDEGTNRKEANTADRNEELEPCWGVELPSVTEIRLYELRALFPTGEEFRDKLPPVVLLHQLFSLPNPLNSKRAYKDIETLNNSGKIKLIKLSSNSGIVFTQDLNNFLPKLALNKKLEESIKTLWKEITRNEVQKSVLKVKYALTDKDISQLIRSGLLVIHDEKSYAFSIPGLGEFMKILHQGRKAILAAIERSKYKELLIGEIERRSFEKTVKLGIRYQLADIIGGHLVNCMETTSGILLKHIPNTKKAKK